MTSFFGSGPGPPSLTALQSVSISSQQLPPKAAVTFSSGREKAECSQCIGYPKSLPPIHVEFNTANAQWTRLVRPQNARPIRLNVPMIASVTCLHTHVQARGYASSRCLVETDDCWLGSHLSLSLAKHTILGSDVQIHEYWYTRWYMLFGRSMIKYCLDTSRRVRVQNAPFHTQCHSNLPTIWNSNTSHFSSSSTSSQFRCMAM